MVWKAFESDFTESQGRNSKIAKIEGLSFEDKKFLKLMEQKMEMMEWHYDVSLLLRDLDTMFPHSVIQLSKVLGTMI